MKLDVGCGERPKGNVNIDLFPMATKHRSPDQTRLSPPLKTKDIPNFICADACHLPLRDKTFFKVYSAHTIEHVNKPVLMIKEMLRVSKNQVVIKCPHRFSHNSTTKILHKYTFNKTWFHKTLQILKQKWYRITVSKWRYFPHPWIPLIRIPQEITIEIYAGAHHGEETMAETSIQVIKE